jgi:AsmA protein
MSKPLRLGLKIFAALLGLLLIVAVSLPFIIDPNDYKDDIIALVRDKTGRELSIPGEIKLSIFPWLGVQLGEVSLSNARGFGKQPMVQVKQAEVRVQLLPLFKKQIRAGTISLSGLQLNLQRAANGRTNWDDLVKAPAKQPAPGKKTGGPSLQVLAGVILEGLEIHNARIDWQDKMAGQQISLTKLELESGQVAPDQLFPLHTAFRIKGKQPALAGSVELESRIRFSPATNRLQLTRLELREDLKGAALPVGRLKSHLRLEQVDVDLAADTASGKGLSLETLGAKLTGEFDIQRLTGRLGYTAKLDIAPFSLRRSLQQAGLPVPKTADPDVLQQLALSTRLKGSLKSLYADPLELVLDDSTLQGNLDIKDFTKPTVRYALDLDHFDADRYLPPAATAPQGKTGKATTAAKKPAPAAGLPLDLLRTLDLQGRLKIGRFRISKLRSSNIFINTEARKGRLRLAPVSAELYGGRYRGKLGLDVTVDPPRLSMDERLENIEVGPLLKDFWGDDKISGKANLHASLTARGLDPVAFRKTLNGSGEFEFRDGVVKGLNIAQMERELKARLEGKPVPRAKGPQQTDFSRITGTLKVTNGLVRNNDLRAALPHARIAGNGQASLVTEQIDYTLKVKFTSQVAAQIGKSYEQIDKVPLVIRITGTFSNPNIRPDFDAILKAAAKHELKKKEKRLKQKLQEKIEKKAEDLFKKLLP